VTPVTAVSRGRNTVSRSSGGRSEPVLESGRSRRLGPSPAHSGCEMKKVLIIEDYYALADIESLLCTMEGYEVKVAKSGDEGLQIFGEFRPDLILLDLMLPGELSGSQVLERIRSDHGDEPKVLVVSALVNPTTAPKLEAYGNVETLGKPFKIKELAARIQSMLDN
jgi:DNA-binding response OmpR family regulator